MDAARYNDGLRGGSIKVRAKISKLDKKTLVINEVPFGRTTSSLIESILKANEKGKIKIRKVDDNTAANVEILVHLAPGIDPDKTMDALFAFTDCEIPISPNACVIENDRPRFVGVTEMLKISTDNTLNLLKKELEIRISELEEDWHMASLEKIFFEERIYRELEKDVETWEKVVDAVERGFDPFRKLFRREITRDDVLKLTEKPVRKISRFDIKKADELIKGIEDELVKVRHNLANIVPYTIKYFEDIRKKYGKGRDRKTEIRSFDNIEATMVVVANEKLYVNWEEGFVGTGLKKDEYLCDCSDIDDVIAIRKDGTYIITKVSEKAFLGKELQYVNVFKKNDNRTIYNVIYRDGKNGPIMMKRCAITGITREKEYTLSKGSPDSRLLYFSANPNGEAEIVRIILRPRPRLKNLDMDVDFGDLAIKGRDAMGNILTRYAIHKILLKEKGSSTLGGTKIWFDETVLRLNSDGKGSFLGEFRNGDRLLVITKGGMYRLSNFELSNHFEDDLLIIEKFDSAKMYSVIYFDGEQKQYYLKRFTFEATDKLTNFTAEDPGSKLIAISGEVRPRFEIRYGGPHKTRPKDIIVADEFIAIKGCKAKGKRLTTYEVGKITEIAPLEPPQKPAPEEPETIDEGPDFDLEADDTSSQMSLDL
jgi:topoisomerase-4 subunit A